MKKILETYDVDGLGTYNIDEYNDKINLTISNEL